MNEDVGISLLTMVPGALGGVETYGRALVRALRENGSLQYRVLLPRIAADADGGLASRVVTSYRAGRSFSQRLIAMGRAAISPGPICREMGVEHFGVIHFPLNIMLPPVDHPRAVTTVFDVQHLVRPKFFSPAERIYRRVVYGWTFKRSRIVITGSHYVARQFTELCQLTSERIRVIPLGVDHKRFKTVSTARQPFVLYPANHWPHKNHERLLRAFEYVRQRRRDLQLVLTGVGHPKISTPGVTVRGYVSPDELARLYQTASALIFPSLYEGFGLPPLEAMACGCPVAAASSSSLPEICGDAAHYFDPTSVEDLAGAIEFVLDHPADLVQRGLERARLFTWEKCARAHEAVYRELLEETHSRSPSVAAAST